MRKNRTKILAAAVAALGLIYLTTTVAYAGPAAPTVTITSCTVDRVNGTVTATGSWTGIRAGAVRSAWIGVFQSTTGLDARANAHYAGSTRTSGTISAINRIIYTFGITPDSGTITAKANVATRNASYWSGSITCS